jgi:prevent-host-death family protein
MKFCSVRDLRINASRVVRRARRERVVITVRGQPTAYLLPLDEGDFDGLDLDLYPELKRSIEEADAAIDRGEGIPLAELKRRPRRRD